MIPLSPLPPLQPSATVTCGSSSVSVFPNTALELVKLDLVFTAGSCYQPLLSLAHAANQLVGEASRSRAAGTVAEFMDFRGIETDRFTDVTTATLSFFFLRKYAGELLPVLADLFTNPLIGEQPFAAYLDRRRQQLAQYHQKTSFVARIRFYEALFGTAHPLGCYACPEDVDGIARSDVEHFVAARYTLSSVQMTLAGGVDDSLLKAVENTLLSASDSAAVTAGGSNGVSNTEICETQSVLRQHYAVSSAVQSSLRIGCLLPFDVTHTDYPLFLVLNTLLGGYFGSRLMTSVREEKGYTYGIYSFCQPYCLPASVSGIRCPVVFCVVADVAADAASAAVDEVLRQIERLKTEPVLADELDRVKSYMIGDLIRTVDGVIEVSERFRQMQSSGFPADFTDRYIEAIRTAIPQDLTDLARRVFAAPLTIVTAGPPA